MWNLASYIKGKIQTEYLSPIKHTNFWLFGLLSASHEVQYCAAWNELKTYIWFLGTSHHESNSSYHKAKDKLSQVHMA